MKAIGLTTLVSVLFAHVAVAQNASEAEVRAAVRAFYAAFNSHDFTAVETFATEDWVHINPLGGQTNGREAVLQELEVVHGSFLKGVTGTPESIEIRFASPDVAVATVPSRMSPHTTPDGVRRENQARSAPSSFAGARDAG